MYRPRNPAGEKAAVYQWVCAATLLLMSGCCGLSGAVLMTMSTSQIIESMPTNVPMDDNVRQALPMIGPALLVGSLVMLFIPCVVLTILAFWVRKGGKASTVVSLVIVGILCGIFAFALLNYLFALAQIPSAGIAIFVVILGVITGLFGKTAYELIRVMKTPGQAYQSTGW